MRGKERRGQEARERKETRKYKEEVMKGTEDEKRKGSDEEE